MLSAMLDNLKKEMKNLTELNCGVKLRRKSYSLNKLK